VRGAGTVSPVPVEPPVVHLRGVVALLGRFPALAGLDLDVARGEIVLLKGPNGAGKTTLLRVCAGLQRVESGTASVLGCDLRRDARAVRRRVGMLGQATSLYDDLTAAENVRFWAAAAGSRHGPSRQADALAALARLEVTGRLTDLPVGRMSTGQRRRVAIAALVVRRPELWLLDEPHAGLDQAGRELLDTLVRDAVAAGATVLLASHELERVEVLRPRQVTVAGGTVHADLPAATPDPTPDAEGTRVP
jgi:heme ABC exporter ATP-binding subunit CcmA